jgi:hypothetical protein
MPMPSTPVPTARAMSPGPVPMPVRATPVAVTMNSPPVTMPMADFRHQPLGRDDIGQCRNASGVDGGRLATCHRCEHQPC